MSTTPYSARALAFVGGIAAAVASSLGFASPGNHDRIVRRSRDVRPSRPPRPQPAARRASAYRGRPRWSRKLNGLI
jgi:hypothetical protein